MMCCSAGELLFDRREILRSDRSGLKETGEKPNKLLLI